MKNNKTSEKKAKNNKLFGSVDNNMLGANMLDSDFADDMKQGVKDFINSASSTFASGAQSNSEANNLTKKMIKNLTDNLNHSFENNVGLSQECLKCKTVVDVIEIQRKFFEHNYQTNIRTCTDLVHDMQQIAKQAMKKTNWNFGK